MRLLLVFVAVCLGSVQPLVLGRRPWKSDEEANLARSRRQIAGEDEKRIVCFFASWSIYREGPNKFTPEDLDPTLCTHLIYGYARPERKEGIVPYDSKLDIDQKLWQRFTSLKKGNPDLKTMLAVGGILEGSARFSKIVADPNERRIFVRSVSSTLNEYGFDGLDMSWVYPGFSEGSSNSDKQNYVILLKELREELGNNILSLTIPGLERLIDLGYDLPEIFKYVDFANVWAGAYHESTDPTVNHPSPLYSLPNDTTSKNDNVDFTIRLLLRKGVDPSKITMLIANYGLYYILADPNETYIGAQTEEEANNTEWSGGLIYNELCQKIRKESWTVMKINSTAMGPYAYKDTQWVAWDDEDIIRNKARYALDMKLGGIGFWTVDMDDFKGFCHLAPYQLLRAGREVFLQTLDNFTPARKEDVNLRERITFQEN